MGIRMTGTLPLPVLSQIRSLRSRTLRVVSLSGPSILRPQYNILGWVSAKIFASHFCPQETDGQSGTWKYRAAGSFCGYQSTILCGTESGIAASASDNFFSMIGHAATFSISAVRSRADRCLILETSNYSTTYAVGFNLYYQFAHGATTNSNADALLPRAFHHSTDLNQVEKSCKTSPATPIATAATETYPASSQYHKEAVRALIWSVPAMRRYADVKQWWFVADGGVRMFPPGHVNEDTAQNRSCSSGRSSFRCRTS